VKAQYPDRFFVFGMCEFRKPGFLSEAKTLVDRGFKGIKIPAARLFIDGAWIRIDGPEFMQMYQMMEEKGLILGIELADGDQQVTEMETIVSAFPRLKIAIGHFGMVTREGWMSQIRLARHENVYIESGGITWLFNDEFYPYPSAIKAIRQAADEVGMEKLMWGSDYPRTITAITYRMSYDFVTKSTGLTDDEKRLFLCDNARKFFGFGQLLDLPYIKNMSE
jgi:predicted TIM-barrel fold metal-dependent hydrolase